MGSGRKIRNFKKERWAFGSRAEKWGVYKKKIPEPRKFLFLGTGRTGSKMIAHAMQAWGYDVLHERTGKDGSSTHFYHADHHWYPMFPWMERAAHVGERKSDFEFQHLIHVIRHPLTCIPSIMAVFGTIDWEFAEETGIIPIRKMSKMERVMHYWYRLNKRVMDMKPEATIKLEEMNSTLPILMNCLYPDVNHVWGDFKEQNKGTGYRRSQPVRWENLIEINPTLAEMIKQLTRIYYV